METQPAKAKAWKRVVVLLFGLFAVAVSVTLFCVASDSTSSTIAKFTLLPVLCIGGIWFIFASLRGRAADVDDTADAFTFRR